MKLELFNNAANNIWKKAAGRTAPEQVLFELEIYKKLLNFFQVGEYYYLVFNVSMVDLEVVDKTIEKLLGYSPDEFNLKSLLDIIHPDDRPHFLNFENKAGQFLGHLPIEKLMKYKMRYDYRIRCSDGNYIRILQQSMVIEHDDKGGIVRTLTIHTDISDLKTVGKPVFSIIGLDGEPSYINVEVEKVFAVSKEFLTKREKQILTLLIEGKLSKQIAVFLNISKQTVDRHRKNMLYKNKLNNTGKLIGKAIRQGWL